MAIKYKVSIILPVYNVEKYLEDCLDSVVNQTLKEIEVICINDTSTDNSLDILHRYQKRNPDIVKIIDLKNKLGTGYARNHGLDIAQGEYIAFLDADDYLDIMMCEKLYNMAKKDGADLIQFDWVGFLEEGCKNEDSIYHHTNSKYFNLEGLCVSKKEDFLLKANVMVWLRFYHCSLWIDTRFPRLTLGEDDAIYMFPLMKAKKIIKYEESLYFKRHRLDYNKGGALDLAGRGFVNELKIMEFIIKASIESNLIFQYERVIFRKISKILCKELFKYRDGMYENAPKSIYDQDSLLDNHFKKIQKIYPKYLEKIIKYSKPRERIKLKMFIWKPVLLKNILYFSFALRRRIRGKS